ncbi:RNA-binding S4 domain-containing protein [Massilia glaciei]|uniref:RNA-binding protein S4 n=1 Tax=Massilia glaciei TaxID=1524097 RepID=A0A2U2HIB0_9BURK|nr:S4 domain-containing protein [Massilia glaciei]PWF46072.1 RNA-binding protein S4 [Massilia glaciei]
MDNIRIDKWLWAARFFKTRSLATDAVDNGRVRLDGERIKPARAVKIDDKLSIDNGAETWEVLVAGISDKRGAAPVARTLYQETDASIARREGELEGRKLYREPGTTIKGRPTKRDRRQLSKASE